MFAVGDFFTLKNGMPGRFIVLSVLSNNRVRGRRWPLADAPDAEEFYLADIIKEEKE